MSDADGYRSSTGFSAEQTQLAAPRVVDYHLPSPEHGARIVLRRSVIAAFAFPLTAMASGSILPIEMISTTDPATGESAIDVAPTSPSVRWIQAKTVVRSGPDRVSTDPGQLREVKPGEHIFLHPVATLRGSDGVYEQRVIVTYVYANGGVGEVSDSFFFRVSRGLVSPIDREEYAVNFADTADALDSSGAPIVVQVGTSRPLPRSTGIKAPGSDELLVSGHKPLPVGSRPDTSESMEGAP